MFDDHLSTAERAEFLQRVIFEYETLEKRRNKIKRGHQRRMPLWLFLIAVIKADLNEVCLVWTDRERYQFMVKSPGFLADVWGTLKENCSMDYAKLSRAMRYYYGKGLVEKVPERPFTYQFIVSSKTKNYLPFAKDLIEPRSIAKEHETFIQRPKSLPDFLSVFSKVKKPNKRPLTPEPSSVPAEPAKETPNPLRFITEPRSRTYSLPAITVWMSPKQSLRKIRIPPSEPSESCSESLNSPRDDLDEFFVTDSFDEFPFNIERKPQKVPLTSCFKPSDLPLLNFDDLAKIDDEMSSETSGVYSPRSVYSSERSCEVDSNPCFWNCQTKERPPPLLSLGKNSSGHSSMEVTTDTAMETAHDTAMDVWYVPCAEEEDSFEVEMGLLSELIIEDSNSGI